MFEKVNPSHPDKMCDRLAGAIVDLAYSKEDNPKIAVEVMAGHGKVFIIIETSLSREQLSCDEIDPIVWRIFGNNVEINVTIVPQDSHLAYNQDKWLRCGDNGIFMGVPPIGEQKLLTAIAASIYEQHPFDGKYIIGQAYDEWPDFNGGPYIVQPIIGGHELTICQSHTTKQEIKNLLCEFFRKNGSIVLPPFYNRAQIDDDLYFFSDDRINPLGPWTGGTDVDSGATNRKMGSDMGDVVSVGGLHGKDLSKADVSVNIACFLKAVASGVPVTACCSIGDENVTFAYYDGKQETETFADIVEEARLYILTDCEGSFERFAEWGLIRPKAEETHKQRITRNRLAAFTKQSD